MGAVTTYTPELAARICEVIASGVSLRALEDQDGMPARSTIRAWAKNRPQFKAALREAREEAAHALADEAMYIADTETDAQRARVRVEVRKWLAGCIAPKSYGPKMELTHHEAVDVGEMHRAGLERARRMRREGTALIPQTIEGETVLVPEPAPGELTIFD